MKLQLLTLLITLMTITCLCYKDNDVINKIIQSTIVVTKDKLVVRKSVLIGDSNVGVIKKTKGFKSVGVSIGPYKIGITTYGLIDILKNSKVDTTYNTIFVAIGTNDGYTTNNSIELRKQIIKIFPKTREIYVIWGSRGWGYVNNKTVKDEDTFYSKFEKNGYKVIKSTDGYFISDDLAHTPNQEYHRYIINQFRIINKIKL